MPKSLPFPERHSLKKHVIRSLSRYWAEHVELVETLPVHEQKKTEIVVPLHLIEVPLPDWAKHCAVNGVILVPLESCQEPEKPEWSKVDWWLAAFLLLECWHERVFELEHGSLHSYSVRLKNWDTRAWDHAWVNRIALFLRAWCAEHHKQQAEDILGPFPKAKLIMTHDVDAVAKTVPIRIKQGVFNLVNMCRAMLSGRFKQAYSALHQSFTFVFGISDWWMLEQIIQQEKALGIRSQFNFYADNRPKTAKRWLFDPGYNPASSGIAHFIDGLVKQGFSIGLHPSFDAWADAGLIQKQRQALEQVASIEVRSCRQHWLRFSFADTWQAQQKAGIWQDTTLMFNDRPGFRASAAVQWNPWNCQKDTAFELQALPSILMDSHFYDYNPMPDHERKDSMAHWVNEVKQVGGEAAILWHPHTLAADYGWEKGFKDLIDIIR